MPPYGGLLRGLVQLGPQRGAACVMAEFGGAMACAAAEARNDGKREIRGHGGRSAHRSKGLHLIALAKVRTVQDQSLLAVSVCGTFRAAMRCRNWSIASHDPAMRSHPSANSTEAAEIAFCRQVSASSAYFPRRFIATAVRGTPCVGNGTTATPVLPSRFRVRR